MAKPDMTPKAVTVRLIRTAQLRRLCLLLRRRSADRGKTPAIPGER
jgi:hypothetical protein